MSEAMSVVKVKPKEATAIIKKAVETKKKTGAKKITAENLNRFTNKMAMRFVELVIENNHLDGMEVDDEQDKEINELIKKYLNSKG